MSALTFATRGEHYIEADRLLQFAQLCIVNKYTPINAMSTERAIQLAHVHALLACAPPLDIQPLVRLPRDPEGV